MAKKKYYLIVIEERVGEREYSFDVVTSLGAQADPHRKADQIAKHWYGNGDEPGEKEADHYSFNAGEMLVDVQRVTEIPQAHYEVLAQYITVL